MRLPLLNHFLFFLFLAGSTLAANMTRSPQRQPSPGKAIYTVYPQPGTDTAKTASFIKKTVGAEDILPWTDLGDNLVSWTVEASSDELAKLRSNSGIARVVDFEAPTATKASASAAIAAQSFIVESEAAKSKRQDKTKISVIAPKDGTNKAQCDQTVAFLTGLTGTGPVDSDFWRGKQNWWIFKLTESQRAEAAKYPGISRIEEDVEGEFLLATAPQPSTAAKLSDANEKRDRVYHTQVNADPELVMVSQPSSIPNLADLKNYVFESHNGDKSFVYHLEAGVGFGRLPLEFPHMAAEHLFSRPAMAAKARPDDDWSPSSHSTCTAGKAVGLWHGASKKATLVIVKLVSMLAYEMISALERIIDDIQAKPERQKRSVITLSIGYEMPQGDSLIFHDMRERIQTLMDMDVPFVASAGNHRIDLGKEFVHLAPAVFAGPDYPMIVVGSTDTAGKRSDFSQGGPKVVVHACGEHPTCFDKEGNILQSWKGTSFAAPIVAGQIANWLSEDSVPFDTSTGNLVKNLRAFLQTDQASWAREPGIRVLWNQVTEADNPKQQQQLAPAEQKTCRGLGSSKYVAREVLRHIIENKFCPDAVAQGTLDKDSGSIMRRYNEKTMEEVIIAIDYRPGLDFKLNQSDCVRYLLGDITDGCDGNDPANPENYKGGGSIRVSEVNYRIEPQTLRQPASKGKQGGCSTTWQALFNDNWVWGHGFESDDWGAALKAQLQICALLPGTWDFQYGLGSDGREWTAKFRTGIWQRGCVGHAGQRAGAPSGFGCSGTG